jgi:uracil-DNA glycosylase
MTRHRATGPDALAEEAEAIARRLRLHVDRAAYAAAGRKPHRPILFAGNLGARVCVIGRDLGREELQYGQPLVGASGREVRKAVLEAAHEVSSLDDPLLVRALHHVTLANLVPYKPAGNRPFPVRVREAFRPVLEGLLVRCFRGDWILALGMEAFDWFASYTGTRGRMRPPDRFAHEMRCRIIARRGDGAVAREFGVYALPHPSPANARQRDLFRALIAQRLAQCL